MARRRRERNEHIVQSYAPIPALCRFENDEQYEFYTSTARNLIVIEERGIDLDKYSSEVKSEFVRRNWAEFAKKPIRANNSLVREFFAIVAKKDRADTVACSREREVYFSEASINAILGMLSMESMYTYERLTSIGINLAEKFRRLFVPDAVWSVTKGGKRTHFPIWDLDLEYKPLLKFVTNRLAPNTSTTTVTPRTATLLYAMIFSEHINVGKEIFDYLHVVARTEKPRSIPFPSLITRLCYESQVRAYSDDMMARTPVDIDPTPFETADAARPTTGSDTLFMTDMYAMGESQRNWLLEDRRGHIGTRNRVDAIAEYLGMTLLEQPTYSTAPMVYSTWRMPRAPFYVMPEAQDPGQSSEAGQDPYATGVDPGDDYGGDDDDMLGDY